MCNFAAIIKYGTIYELTLKLKTIRIIYKKNNLNNLRGNQLPAALKESHVSVNKYINPIKYEYYD